MDNERKYYVYAYIRLDSNTYFYIGKGKDDRWRYLKNRSKHFLNILNKCECTVEFLYTNLNEEEAFRLEEGTINDLVFIEGYSIEIKGFTKNKKHLVNQTWGGEGASGRIYRPTPETIEKLRQSHIGQVPWNKGKTHSEETIEKLRQSQIGKPSPMKGKHHTEESKEKMRKGHLNKSPNMTEEELKRRGQKIKEIREENGSYGHTEETKEKISNTLKGKLVGSKNGMSKAIICLNDNRIFESCRLACLFYNISPSHLCKALKQNKEINGLKFMYLKDYNANND